MKNVIFIVGSYYPNYSAVGKCQGNLACEMENQGYNVTVIAQKSNIDDLDSDYLGKQHIIRISTSDINSNINIKDKLKKGSKSAKVLQYYYKIKRTLKSIFSKNSINNELVNSYYKALELLEFQPDLIIPTCLPFETIITAIKYKQKFNNCKVIPCLYDMFAESGRLQRFDWNYKLKLKNNYKLEESVFQESDKVLHMPSWTPYIEKRFPEYKEKTIEIEHPLMIRPNSQKKMDYDSECINIIYTGVVDLKIRNPKYVLDFFESGYKNENIKLHFYSLGSAQHIVEQADENSDIIISHGQVDSKTASFEMISANVLLSIGNKINNQFPSKIFEYMSTGHPIIHFAYNDEDPAIQILNQYPISCCIIMDYDEIAKKQEEIRNFVKNHSKTVLSFDTVSNIFNTANPKHIIKIIITIVN